MKKDSFMYPILFMAILTIIFTAILAILNHNTTDVIAFNEETDLRKTILYVFNIDVDMNNPDEIENVFSEKVEETKDENGERLFLLKENSELKAYAFPVHGTALWGTVDGYVAISSDYSTLLGLDFTQHSETPGLGGRISELEFKEQFRGLDLQNAKDGKYIVYRPDPSGNVDAISGATQTSDSVSEFLNKDIDEFIRKGSESK